MHRRGKPVSRVLYWYRTPPDVKVGREPFDASVRQALEAQYPNVRFDWRQILETPIPSADAEKWRERRRAERSERAARHAAEQEDEAVAETPLPGPAKHVIEAATDASPNLIVSTAVPAAASPDPSDSLPEPVAPQTADASGPGFPRRKRRRRRGGRPRPPAAPSDTPAPPAPAGDEHATDTDE